MKNRSKKLLATILLLGFVSCVVIYVWQPFNSTATSTQQCAFCNPTVLQTQTFYEDRFVRGLCTHKPIQPYHCLIVVKRHIERFEEATDQEIAAIGHLVKKINVVIQKINGPSAYLLLQKNGPEVGQTVPHVHVHYIPKKESAHKNVAPFGLLWSFVCESFQKPMPKEELAVCVETMKKNF